MELGVVLPDESPSMPVEALVVLAQRAEELGYAVLNLDIRYRFLPGWELFANVGNVFNTRYQNFGILGVNFFRGPGNTYAPALAQPEQFRSPGAPLGAWVGVRYEFADGLR